MGKISRVIVLLILLSTPLTAQELFIHKPTKLGLSSQYSAYLVTGNYPSYNDLSGKPDKRLFVLKHEYNHTQFRCIVQMIAHDDGHRRTKFDWHFSLRYKLGPIIAIAGHDSNHDSDYSSYDRGWFVNRNYVGVGLPIEIGKIHLEPFIWGFADNTNQRIAGERLKYEYGMRVGANIKRLNISFQAISQMGKAVLSDMIIRYPMYKGLHISYWHRIWTGEDRRFYSLGWGIVILV